MNDADPSFFRITSSCQGERLIADDDLSVVVRDNSGQDLHQRAFASPVLAAEC